MLLCKYLTLFLYFLPSEVCCDANHAYNIFTVILRRKICDHILVN